MKTKLIIIFLFLSSLTIAQKKFEVTAVGGTNYMFIPDSLNPMKTKTGKFAYQTGLELSYRVFKNFRIGVGGIYSTMSFDEIFKKIPGDDIFNYDIYVNHKLKFTEFPLYIRYDIFMNRKLSPYVKFGYSFIKIKQLEDKLLKTDPAGHETEFWVQFYNFTFKNDMLFITDINAVFAGMGVDYKLTEYLTAGIDLNAKRFFYYEFDNKRSNYTLSGNLRISFVF